MDIEDQVIKAIQSYRYADGSPCGPLLALAECLAPHVIKELGLRQEWGVATAFTQEDGGEFLDDVSGIGDKQVAQDRLQRELDWDKSGAANGFHHNGRRYLATHFYTEWAEDDVDPVVDADLAALVAEDADL